MKLINRFGGKAMKIATCVLLLLLFAFIVTRLFTKENNRTSYEKIFITGKDSFNNDSDLNKTTFVLPVKLSALDNFNDYKVQFIIPKDTLILINVVGEGADYKLNPFLFKSYDNDGIELYFDMRNEKLPFFDVTTDDRQYRILWNSLKIDGQNIETKGINVSEKDPTLTTYSITTSIPWKTLGFFTPKNSAKIGFDIAIMDSDGGAMKALTNWNSKSADSWKNTSYLGNLILLEADSIQKGQGYAVAIKRKVNNNKGLHVFKNTTPFFDIRNVTIGTVRDTMDLSGKFQAEWDERNLYLRVKVRDDIKTIAKALFDYGWIEDQNGKVVWKMTMEESRPAGGASKNRRVDTTIRIKKGKYWLKYHTDESHSPNKWDDKPPASSLFYGIKLSYIQKR